MLFPINGHRRPLRFVVTASALAMGVALSTPALANCPFVTATDVECTGPNPNTTVNNSGAGARTVTVAQGASVSSGQTTVIAQGTPSTITNNGTIATDSSAGSSDYAAALATSNTGTARIVNNAGGVISATGTNVMGARFITQNGLAELVNAGTISASGTSSSGSFGPRGVALFASSSDARIINSGSITSTSVGVAIDHSGTGETYVSNASGGVMSGAATGIYIRNARGPVQVDNAGQILRTSTGTGGFLPAALAIFDQDPGATGTQVIITNSGTIGNAGPLGSFAIYAAQNANGVLEVNNTGTVNGDIVQFGGLLALIDNAGTINGNIQTGAGDDTVILRGANVVMNGRLDGGLDADTLRFTGVDGLLFTQNQQTFRFENIVLESGTLRFNGASFETFGSEGIGAFTTQAGATLAVTGAQNSVFFADGGTTTIDGTLVLDPLARLFLGAGTGVSHDFLATSGSTTRFVLDTVSGSTGFSGQIHATNIAFQSGSVIDLDVRDLDLLVNGRAFDVAVATNSLTDASGAITDNSVLFDFSKQLIGGNTLRITMEQLLSISDTINPADPNSAALAGALQGLIDSGSPGGNAVSTVLGGFSTVETLAAAVADFAPDSSNMLALGGLAMVDPLLANVRSRAASHAMNEGGVQLWLTGGLFSRSSDAEGMALGFDGDGTNFAFGGEVRLGGSGALALGLGYDHASGDFTNDGARSTADLSADRVFAYAFLPTGPLRLNATLGLGWGEADTARAILVLGDTATGATSLDSSFGRLELGYDLGSGAFVLTPLAGIQFASVNVDAFAETGADGALSFAEQSLNSTRADIGLGLRWADTDAERSGWRIDAALRYAGELNDTGAPLRAQFVGGGTGFDWATGDLPGSAVELDAGAHWRIGGLGTLSLAYRGSFAGGADAHAGMLTLSTGF
ncbi:autotransporter outer membrane beta-barrel domain-containing protein [Erythrobacter sp. EC-HK427]|uniref:autotransporter outer membrane beta-barrel domain-containing protein n=1 Tax=Erythrobacter sp. EC-HK427 TaxID=2038396 RepID=UPI0012538B51|nr:autotransporter domain-containing protein [Erythrobacter sp. EC-HK427]VVT04527.1 exported hypothetical protein [Erythrobacter sp. EC-HK427]